MRSLPHLARHNWQNGDDKKIWISDVALAKLYPEQDAMQWVTLPPIATSVKNRKVNRHGEGSPLKVRKVAVTN
eukprot:scaffold65811_cov43-Cyclotella_meneghiniana.AAC.7